MVQRVIECLRVPVEEQGDFALVVIEEAIPFWNEAYGTSFPSWANALWIDRRITRDRRERRWQSFWLMADMSPVESPGEMPDSEVIRSELWVRVMALLDGLPARQQEALRGCLAGDTGVAIARRMGVHPSTVGRLVRRGIETIKEGLDGC